MRFSFPADRKKKDSAKIKCIFVCRAACVRKEEKMAAYIWRGMVNTTKVVMLCHTLYRNGW